MKCFLFHYIFLLLFIFNCCLVFIKLVISDGGQRRREILNLRVQKERKTRSKSIEKWNHLAEQEVTLDMAPRAEWVILTAWCEGQFQGAPTPISTSPSANNPRGEEDGCKGQPWGRLRAGGAHELTSWMKGQHPPNNLAGLHRLTPSSSILSKISLCSSWLMRKCEPLSNQSNKYDLSPNYVSYVQISVQGARRIKHHFECFDLLFCVFFCSVVSDSSQPHGLKSARLPCPWDFPGKNTGMGCHFLLQRIFHTQGWNLGLLHCRQTLSHLGYRFCVSPVCK